MPWMVKDHGEGKYCVHKENDDKTPGEELICYTGEGAKEQAEDYKKALYANEDKSEMMMFTFVDLQSQNESLVEGRPIDGMAAGAFVAMNGKRISFKESELQTYLANTQRVIESTKDSTGAVIGLPIDTKNHDHLGGAGWIVGLELDSARKIIKFMVKWTKEGVDLIKNNTRRFFSPSINVQNKTILGGSLTNWPATRNNQGLMILRPIELSQTMKEIDMEKTVEELLADQAAKLEASFNTKVAELEKKFAAKKTEGADDDLELTPEELQAFLNSESGVEELSKRAQAQATKIVNFEKRKQKVMDFASMVRGGTAKKPFGIPVRSNKLIGLLLRLNEKDSTEVMELISAVWKTAIDFQEHGFAGELVTGKRLDKTFHELATKWVESGKPIQEFFTVNNDVLGDIGDYNVAEFMKEKE